MNPGLSASFTDALPTDLSRFDVKHWKNRSLYITQNLSSEEKTVTVKKKPVSVKKTPLQWRKNPFQWRKNRYSEEKNRYFFLLLFIPNFSWQFIATFFLSFFLHFPWLFYHFLQWVLWLYTQKYPENWKKQSVHFFSLFLECSKFFLLFVTCFTFTRK